MLGPVFFSNLEAVASEGGGGGVGPASKPEKLLQSNFCRDLGPMPASRSLASWGVLTAGQPIDGLNMDANSVSSIQVPIRTRFGNKSKDDSAG